MRRTRVPGPSWRPETGDGSSDPTVPRDPDDRGSTSIPRQIGPYHIKRRIAAGGMGVVYEAVQENPRRSVALKLMKPGLVSHSAARRFEFEAQLLARLRHPGIAQIYDAGNHEEGGVSTPYFAMEYIPGALPLTAYAKRKKLGVNERLELFRQACDAVHHGHQKGIIHRDLKPDNLLVDSRGRVKVIDFGVARSTDSDMAMTTMQTSVGQLIGTLQYMSPEQIHGDPSDIDTRSDVYSLGVILYELLCGSLPYDVRGSSIVEATRVIEETAPTRPSAVDRHLRGDVETVVLKALEKDRDRRYQSAHGLSQDIGRFLTGEPIVARAPSLTYQVRMFARRNKVAFAGVLGVVAALVVGLVVSTSLYVRAEDARRVAAAERDRAKVAEEKAQAINDFLLDDLLGAANPEEAQGRDLTVREVVQEAARKVGGSFEGRPGLEVPIRLTLQDVFLELADYEAARVQAEAAEALAVREFGPEDPRTLEAQRARADVIAEERKEEEAIRLYRDILAAQRRVLGDRDPSTLTTINDLAVTLLADGSLEEAETLFQEALDGRRAVLGESHKLTIETMLGQADVFSYRWRQTGEDSLLDRSFQAYRNTLDTCERVIGKTHPITLVCLNNFATTLWTAGQYDEAVAMFRRANEADTVVYGDNHPYTLIGLSNLGSLLQRLDRAQEATDLLVRSVAGWKSRPFDPRSLNAINGLAETWIPRGREDQAQALLEETIPIAEPAMGSDDPLLLRTVVNLGWAHRTRGDLARAEPYYRRTMEGREKVLGPDHQYTLRAMSQLGALVSRRGRPEEGERLCREALRRGRAALPEGHGQMATLLQYLAHVLLDTDRPAEAVPILREALAIRLAKNSSVEVAECESLLAGALLRVKEYPEAEELLGRAYPVLCRVRGQSYETRREARARIEELCRQTGRAAETGEVLARIERTEPERTESTGN